jgi:hypothetical protein
MDVSERLDAWLPGAVESVEENGPLETAQLWLMARAYSRLRHRTSPRRNPEDRQRFETLKTHCMRLAVVRNPELFLIFVDPAYRHLLIVYHRVERTLLHVPVAVWCDGARAVIHTGSRGHASDSSVTYAARCIRT